MNPASQAARDSALVIVEPELGCLVATGPDRVSWLNGIVSCDVAKVTPSEGAWGLALSKQAKILSELYLVSDEARLYIATSAGTASEIRTTFDRMLVMEDAELVDCSSERVWARLHGPRAAELARTASAETRAAWGAIDWTGLGGAAIAVERSALDAVLGALRAGGALVGAASDWERLSIERGVPRYGVDFGGNDNPHEASLDQRAVSWTKGCYLGQEVVCMQDMRGRVKRRVVPLLLEGEQTPAIGAAVTASGEAVGEITSAAYSELLARAVAQARVKAAHASAGAELAVGGVRAIVSDTPA